MKKSFLSRALLPLTFITLSLFLFNGCGKNTQNQIVKDIAIQSSVKDDQVWVSLAASFMVGNLSFTAITIPIMNPKMPNLTYGEISFLPTLTPGFNEVKLSLNLSEVAKIQGGLNATLPNGSPIPIGGIANNPVIEILIPGTNTKIYFALDQKTVLLGFAAAVKEFDILSTYLGGANIFLGFNIQGVLGSAGLFTSKTPGQNGLGLFVDLSSVINTEILNHLIAGQKTIEIAKSSQFSGSSALSDASANGFSFLQSSTSTKQMLNLKKGMDSMQKRSRNLNLH